MIANLSFFTFLHKNIKKPAGNKDSKTIGSLAVNSETIPVNLKERHSI